MIKKRIITGTILILIFSFCVIALSSVSIKSKIDEKISFNYQIKEELSSQTNENSGISSFAEPTVTHNEVITALLCGVDKTRSLTDVIVLARYDKTENTVVFLQIPRDSFVGNLTSTGKLNGVLALRKDRNDGIKLLKSTVEDMLKLKIDYSAMINLNAFRKVVDLMGGIEFDVPFYVDYLPNKVLYKGYQTLNGEQAEWLIRYRKGYATGDIGRLAMQKNFVIAALGKAKNLDIITLTRIVKMAYEEVETDFPLSLSAEILPKLITISDENIRFFTLEGNGEMYGKSAVYVLDKAKTTKILNEHFRFEDEMIGEDELNLKSVS
ncbi:MAG: LCP family protein [Oscillospiraceae bacterium]